MGSNYINFVKNCILKMGGSTILQNLGEVLAAPKAFPILEVHAALNVLPLT